MALHFLKISSVFLLLFFSQKSLAWQIDSVSYKGEWLKIYPWDQKATLKSKTARLATTAHSSEIIIPMGSLPDGKYIQFAKFEDDDVAYFRFAFRLNKVGESKKIPFALFQIENNKLNGQAEFLNGFGDIVEAGVYEDNLKSGIWHKGTDLENYVTYDKGIQNGKTVASSIVKKFGKIRFQETREQIFVDGKMISSVQINVAPGKVIRIEKTKIDSLLVPRYTYKKYVNDKLLEQGVVNSSDHRSGPCFFYNPETGQLLAEVEFDLSMRRDESNLYNFWAENLYFEDMSHLNFILYGLSAISIQGKYGYNYHYVDTYENSSALYFKGTATQFYESGEKMISYWSDGFEFYLDTLFYKNGEPKYFAFPDIPNRCYVAQYFDEKGTLVNEVRKSWYDESKYKHYMGLELRKSKYNGEESYEYNFLPSFDSISNPASKKIYTRVTLKQDQVVTEIYFDCEKRIRHHRYDMGAFEKNSFDFSLEILEEYNEDYTGVAITKTLELGGQYKVVTTENIDYCKNYPFQNSTNNLIKLDRALWDMDSHVGIYGDLRGDYGYVAENNHHESFTRTSNQKTVYTLAGEPISGPVTIDFGKRKFEMRKNKSGLHVNLTGRNRFRKNDFVPPHDRMGMRQMSNALNLVPDLFAQFPATFTMEKAYRGVTTFSLDSYWNRVEKISGQFYNGQLHGNWKVYDFSNELMMDLNFAEGKATGTNLFYSSRRNTKSYVTQKVIFADGNLKDVFFFNWHGDTTIAVYYVSGQPSLIKTYHYQFNEWFNDGARKELVSIKEGIFTAGELTEVRFTDVEGKKPKVWSFACVDDLLSGPVDYGLDSGFVSNGKFTGVQTMPEQGDKVSLTWIDQNRIVKKQCFSADKNLLWEIRYDTVENISWANIKSLFTLFPWTKFPYDTLTYKRSSGKSIASYQSWYDNGVLHSAGSLSLANNGKHIDKWKFYAPSGDLITEIDYRKDSVLNSLAIDSLSYDNFGSLVQYKNGKPVYEAKILSYITRYNCPSDQVHELRILYVERDIDERGNVVERPTRNLQIFYDTGVLQSEGQILDGLPQGLWKFYDDQGGLTAIGQMDKGLEDGVWFFGDLTGLNFLGEYCMVLDSDDLNKNLEEVQRELDITMKTYRMGRQISTVLLQGFTNQ